MFTLQRTVASFVEEARLLEATNYGRAPSNPSGGRAGEPGDDLFVVVCPANTTGVDLEAVLDGAALGRYRERLALGGDAGSGR